MFGSYTPIYNRVLYLSLSFILHRLLIKKKRKTRKKTEGVTNRELGRSMMIFRLVKIKKKKENGMRLLIKPPSYST